MGPTLEATFCEKFVFRFVQLLVYIPIFLFKPPHEPKPIFHHLVHFMTLNYILPLGPHCDPKLILYYSVLLLFLFGLPRDSRLNSPRDVKVTI